ncbi:ModE molybdate transport repressor domain-containing protein [Noviherbaspirillum humi]|uniref:ModE molybdate transport repressor domain-containing protein n=1 Tax=Noviherbaspirillum humi TaxID=1688639 RepID=A0A239GQV4_9BURK|nr:substrate-binding domain-containing protein [Noviherbaspirillum humi]SNS71606.1 ModE molybdate transport repressor domain-containing protein [Noviherbaspirillum humi]
MYRIKISPHWEIARGTEEALDTAILLSLLKAVQDTGSIAQAAQAAGLSYRYAWGLLRDGEKLFGSPLMQTGRGRGTRLTPLAEKLIWADRRIAARLTPTLESLASELGDELNRMVMQPPATIRIDASHGFAVAAMLNHLDAARLPVKLRYRNSTDAVAALAQNECDLAGFHVPLGKFEQAAARRYAQWLDPARHCLIHLAVRRQGLFLAPGNPKHIGRLEDLLRPDVRFVNRQAGSGTRMLVELMLADAGMDPARISGFDSAEFTHSAVAAYIASGMADVGIGVETAARRFGLDFLPLLEERYFFAVPIAGLEQTLMREVRNVLQSPAFRDEVQTLSGYDAGETGRLLKLEEAFPAT